LNGSLPILPRFVFSSLPPSSPSLPLPFSLQARAELEKISSRAGFIRTALVATLHFLKLIAPAFQRGAFTGAVTRKQGRLEMAQGGTIVLDEVAALTPGMQAKLLRVIEERTFERLGGTDSLRMDARLMALTNTDLAKAVATGRFREDLYFRLNVLAVPVPPLRERRADIPALTAHFLARLGPVHGRPDAILDPAALHLFESYAWPGNVRE
jgi:transcriptional regulator with PAS, ATPase and Fis domain